MKEQDKPNSKGEQNELTNQPNSSNLRREGDIFMADGPSNPENGEPKKPEEAGSSRTIPETSRKKPRAKKVDAQELALREINEKTERKFGLRALRDDLLFLKRLRLIESKGQGRGARWFLKAHRK